MSVSKEGEVDKNQVGILLKKEVADGFEAPKILWEEDYEPVGMALSCAKQPGNPGCAGGPFGS